MGRGMSNVRPDPVVLVEIGGGIRALMASESKNGVAVPLESVLSGSMQALLAEATKTLNFSEGEYTMLIADMPNAPPSMPSVLMVAQANTNQKSAMQREHIMGICELVNTSRA